MALVARDVMQSHVISLSPETPLLDAQRLFLEEEINGAPVIDETGRLVGVISATDLLRAADPANDGEASETGFFRDDGEISSAAWPGASERFEARLSERSVGEVMTRGGVSVTPDASVAEVAGMLRRHRIHRVLVVEDERLCGIISSFDLVALLEKPC